MSEPRSLFEILFGPPRGVRSQVVEAVLGKLQPPTAGPSPLERDRYQDAMMSELLTTLAGKGTITNEDARGIIARAKATTAAKMAADKQPQPPPAQSSDALGPNEHAECGGRCPIHDTRPHTTLPCSWCQGVTPHLLSGNSTVATCRKCATTRSV